jgi:WD40 repeat protein
MFDIHTVQPNPIKTFEGHTSRVYNVLFNPIINNIIVSGSDDKSIIVWDSNKVTCTPVKVLGAPGDKNAHSANVRALAFLPETPWCLLTGGWDSQIKVWDIRSGNCMLSLSDHNSDVYGIQC